MKLILQWHDGEMLKGLELTDDTQPVQWPAGVGVLWLTITFHDPDKQPVQRLINRANYGRGFMWWLGELRAL